MRVLYTLLFFCCIAQVAYCSVQNDSLLKRLNNALADKDRYVSEKEVRIKKLNEDLLSKNNDSDKFEVYQKLYNEYKSFSYDSAYTYSKNLLKIALQLKDRGKIARSQMEVSFTLLSSGMFNETLGILDKVDVKALHDTDKVEYYFLKGRCYFDWADFDHNEDYTRTYREKAIHYLDSALAVAKPSSYNYYTLSGLKYLRLEQYPKSAECYEKALALPALNTHDFAVTASTLSYVYQVQGKQQQSEALLIRAAIADLETATKETVAIYRLLASS